MKSLIAVLAVAFAVTTTASAAPTAQAFVGKYEIVDKLCEIWSLRDAERVYVRTGKFLGKDSLEVVGYGDDAGGLIVMLGKGSRQEPGTSIETHGKVTQSWETTIRNETVDGSSGTIVRSSSTTVSKRTQYSEVTSLALSDGKLLVIVESYPDGGLPESKSCLLKKSK